MAMALTILLDPSRRECCFFRRHRHRIVSAITKGHTLRLFFLTTLKIFVVKRYY
jgi:hypothetical protein